MRIKALEIIECPKCHIAKKTLKEIYYSGMCYECKTKYKQRIAKEKFDRQHPICKKCGEIFEVNKFATMAEYCPKCKEKLERELTNPICKKCNKHFVKLREIKRYICYDCSKETKEDNNKTFCLHCKRLLDRSCYHGGDSICIECKTKEAEATKIRRKEGRKVRCMECGEYNSVQQGVTRYRCKKCKEKLFIEILEKLKATCITCYKNFLTKYKEVNGNHFKEYLLFLQTQECNCKKTKYSRLCLCCDNIISVDEEHAHATNLRCEKCKDLKIETICKNNKFYRICRKCDHEFEIASKYSQRYFCFDCRPKNIETEFERKQCFGYSGFASDGHRFSSLTEQDVDEWLFENKIEHVPHPNIPNSPNYADQFLPKYDLYLEIDGMNRIDDIDWCGKLSLYEKLDLSYKIIKSTRVHFRDNKEECFKLLNNQLSFLL